MKHIIGMIEEYTELQNKIKKIDEVLSLDSKISLDTHQSIALEEQRFIMRHHAYKLRNRIKYDIELECKKIDPLTILFQRVEEII